MGDDIFSQRKYRSFLNKLRIKNEDFLDQFYNELLHLKYKNSVDFSDFMLKNHIRNMFSLFKKSLDLTYVKFVNKSKKYTTAKETDIYKYYRKHYQKYKTPNRISFKYIFFNLYDEIKKIDVDEND